MPDPIQEKSLEDAAVMFLKRSAWVAAVGMFTALAHHRPKNSSAWVGIGSALWRLAPNDPEVLTPALAAAKRALALDPHDHAIKNLLRSTEDSARKAGINPDDVAAYSGDPRPFYPDLVNFDAQMLAEMAHAMDWEERARLVTLLGDQMDDLFQPLLEHLAANDPHAMVKKQAQQALRDREAYHKAHAAPPAPAPAAPTEILPRSVTPDAPPDDVVVTPAAPAPADVVSAIPAAAPGHPPAAAPAAAPAPRPTAEQAQDTAQKAQQDDAVQKALAERRARLMGKSNPEDK